MKAHASPPLSPAQSKAEAAPAPGNESFAQASAWDETQHAEPRNIAPVALVTGAGKRIGRAIALGLARARWDVVVHYQHSLDDAQKTADEVRALGQRAWTLAADLSVPAEVDGLFQQALKHAQGLDAVINNASRFAWDGPRDVNAEGLLGHWMPNLVAPVLLTQTLFAHCSAAKPSKQGVVINLLDQKLHNPNPDFFFLYPQQSRPLAGHRPHGTRLCPAFARACSLTRHYHAIRRSKRSGLCPGPPTNPLGAILRAKRYRAGDRLSASSQSHYRREFIGRWWATLAS